MQLVTSGGRGARCAAWLSPVLYEILSMAQLSFLPFSFFVTTEREGKSGTSRGHPLVVRGWQCRLRWLALPATNPRHMAQLPVGHGPAAKPLQYVECFLNFQLCKNTCSTYILLISPCGKIKIAEAQLGDKGRALALDNRNSLNRDFHAKITMCYFHEI